MSNYWNWYFECPFCEQEIDCHIEENTAEDGHWLSAELPDECPLCDCELVDTWGTLEMDVIEHYKEYHKKPEEDGELSQLKYENIGKLYESYDPLGALHK